MKKTIKLSIIGLASFMALAIGNMNGFKPTQVVNADGEWEIINTKALAYSSTGSVNPLDGYYYIQLSTSDYSQLAADHLHINATSAPYFKLSDYNFLDHIMLSKDKSNYIPYSEIYETAGLNYFFQNGRFRLGLKRDTATIKDNASYTYVKILEGCEFPSYDYCVNGGTKKKYVQQELTFSKQTNTHLEDNYFYGIFSEQTAKRDVTYKEIAPGWNDYAPANTPGYHHIILAFNTDYLANNHEPNSTNQATSNYDAGKMVTINGVPLYKIREKYSNTAVNYAHGFNYFYISYPVDVLEMNHNNLVPTLHVAAGTEFMDCTLPEITLKFAGGKWHEQFKDDYKVTNPVNIDNYLQAGITLPHEFGLTSHAVFKQFPAEGAQIAFNLNTGKYSEGPMTVLLCDGPYKTRLAIYAGDGNIQLFDLEKTDDQGNPIVIDTIHGFKLEEETSYTFEFDISITTETRYRLAINHFVVLDHTFDYAKTCGDTWMYDTSGKMSLERYEEHMYQPKIVNTGSISYDFMEGDSLYDFSTIFSAVDLYDSVNNENLSFEYEKGAVTNDKYNAGDWTLTVTLSSGNEVITSKSIEIHVHGSVSTANVYFDDGDPIKVVVGEKVTPPTSPETYTVGEYDYIFDGWYNGAVKWDFENDVVEGDLHLASHFTKIPHRYKINVTYQGIDRDPSTYYLAKNKTLSFDVFALEGATFEVFLNNTKITTLVVENDVDLVVKYTVVYIYLEAKAATCTEDGNVACWYSPIYPGYYFADSEGKEVIENAIIPALGHNIIHLEYKDSTCSEIGNVDCYYCLNCGEHYSDPNGEHILEDWMIEKKPHTLEHHPEVPATCDSDGIKEYWSCVDELGVYYGDEEGTFTLDNIVIPALGHDFINPTYTWIETDDGYECKASLTCSHCGEEYSEIKTATKVVLSEATCSAEGRVSYSVSFEDPRFSAQTKIVTTPKLEHHYVFVEAIEVTPEHDGVKEHYECSECHHFFILENGEYVEVEYTDLIVKYKAPPSVGCGGNIATTSVLLFTLAGILIVLVSLKKKEER